MVSIGVVKLKVIKSNDSPKKKKNSKIYQYVRCFPGCNSCKLESIQKKL